MKRIYKLVMMITVFSIIFSVAASAISSEKERIPTSSLTNNIPSLDRDFFASAEISTKNGIVSLTRDYQTGSRTNNDSHIKETMFFVPSADSTAEEINENISAFFASTKSGGSKYQYEYDDSISVMGYLTIYYNSTTIDNVDYAKLTSVSGGYSILDRQVKVNSQIISAGCSGAAMGIGWIDQDVNFEETTASWSYTAPSDWVYVECNNFTHFIGAVCTYTLQRAGSTYTWDFSVTDQL